MLKINRKRTFIFILAVILTGGSLTSIVEVKSASEDPNVENVFKADGLPLNKDTYIIAQEIDDVTGDKIKDKVTLIGSKPGGREEIYIKGIGVAVQDGKTKKYTLISIGPINSGYSPKLFLGDFDRDKVADIFVSVGNGGSGGTSSYSLLSLKDGKGKPLFDQEKFSLGLEFDVNFKHSFKVEVRDKASNKTCVVDVSANKQTYLDMGVYDASGKLLKPATGRANNYSSLEPVDEDKDGVYELKGKQRFSGVANADTIGYADSIWKSDGGEFKLTSLDVY
jgi:hypothetical protein